MTLNATHFALVALSLMSSATANLRLLTQTLSSSLEVTPSPATQGVTQESSFESYSNVPHRDSLNDPFTLPSLNDGDRISAELALGHAIEVAYYVKIFQKQYEGMWFLDSPSQIEQEWVGLSISNGSERAEVNITEETRSIVKNVTTVCPPSSTVNCSQGILFEQVSLSSNVYNTTGLSGLEDGSASMIPSSYEYGLYVDAPGYAPDTVVSSFPWIMSKEQDTPQAESGTFYYSGYLTPNKTVTQRKEILLKQIELTGQLLWSSHLRTSALDDSMTDSLHFKIRACARRTEDVSALCEMAEVGPFSYAWLVDALRGSEDLLCRFVDTEFCLIRLGLHNLEVSTLATFKAVPAAYTNEISDINGHHHEERTNTRFLPSVM